MDFFCLRASHLSSWRAFIEGVWIILKLALSCCCILEIVGFIPAMGAGLFSLSIGLASCAYFGHNLHTLAPVFLLAMLKNRRLSVKLRTKHALAVLNWP